MARRLGIILEHSPLTCVIDVRGKLKKFYGGASKHQSLKQTQLKLVPQLLLINHKTPTNFKSIFNYLPLPEIPKNIATLYFSKSPADLWDQIPVVVPRRPNGVKAVPDQLSASHEKSPQGSKKKGAGNIDTLLCVLSASLCNSRVCWLVQRVGLLVVLCTQTFWVHNLGCLRMDQNPSQSWNGRHFAPMNIADIYMFAVQQASKLNKILKSRGLQGDHDESWYWFASSPLREERKHMDHLNAKNRTSRRRRHALFKRNTTWEFPKIGVPPNHPF